MLTDKTVSIKCACEMSTSENVTHVITELDAGAGAAQINTGILLTAGYENQPMRYLAGIEHLAYLL